MQRRFIQVEDGRNAGIAVLKQRTPFRLRPLPKDPRKARLDSRPTGSVVAGSRILLVQANPTKFTPKGKLYRANGNVAPVSTL
jgi:hypothetical protein